MFKTLEVQAALLWVDHSYDWSFVEFSNAKDEVGKDDYEDE